MSASKVYRKSFTFHPIAWEELRQVAIEKGYRSRNQFITTTLKNIMEDHQQAKSHDLA